MIIARFYGHQQAKRIERKHSDLKKGEVSRKVAYKLTSLSADETDPEPLLALVRNHWHIKYRLHYMSTFTDNEDRYRVRIDHLPRSWPV